MPLMSGLRTVRSKIHGYGIVTQRRFRKGETVLFGDGILYRESEEFDDTYALILPGYEKHDDGSEGDPLYWDLTCQSRWINHSCSPNTEVDSYWDDDLGEPTCWWVATRDIEIGEELTYDYAFSGHLAEPCFCATANCRGVICDEDELHLVPEKHRHLLKPLKRAVGQ